MMMIVIWMIVKIVARVKDDELREGRWKEIYLKLERLISAAIQNNLKSTGFIKNFIETLKYKKNQLLRGTTLISFSNVDYFKGGTPHQKI